jgi:hypothetical protein
VSDGPAHDPGRFARAFKLARDGGVKQIGPRQYRVAGNEQPYYDVDLDGDPPCYCEDQDWSGRRIRNNCKHTLAARIVAQEPSVIPSLMELAYALEQRKAS